MTASRVRIWRSTWSARALSSHTPARGWRGLRGWRQSAGARDSGAPLRLKPSPSVIRGPRKDKVQLLAEMLGPGGRQGSPQSPGERTLPTSVRGRRSFPSAPSRDQGDPAARRGLQDTRARAPPRGAAATQPGRAVLRPGAACKTSAGTR